MIKDNQRYFNRLQVLIDAIVIITSYILAWYVRLESGMIPLEDNEGVLGMLVYFSLLYVIVPVYLMLYSCFRLYTPRRVSRVSREVYDLVKANTCGIIIILGGLYLIYQMDYSRSMMFLFYMINMVLGGIVRQLQRIFLLNIRKRGYNIKYVLLVGYSRATEEYINRIEANPQWGYVVRGILDDQMERGVTYKGVRVIGHIDNLFLILPENKLDEIAVTLALADYGRLEEIVTLCEKSGVHTKFIPDYNSVIPSKPYTEDLLGLPVINIRHVPLSNTMNQIAKRIVDVVGAIIGIVLSSPIMVLCMMLIKVTSKGPIIFSQERVGLHNKGFSMYKFRSMKFLKPKEDEQSWTVKDDPRVTKIGKFMRRTSIDEIPQLFNVLRGDMSLIGPRPEQTLFVEKFKEEIPRYMIKHQVRPGLTGWAQVNGYRGDTSIRKRIEYDLYYIENWSMGLDVKIVVLTIIKGFVNKNAY
ncbi:MAG: undecaprenyl-phosphate glucose phosphotransferase [Eubacteriales bacterium]